MSGYDRKNVRDKSSKKSKKSSRKSEKTQKEMDGEFEREKQKNLNDFDNSANNQTKSFHEPNMDFIIHMSTKTKSIQDQSRTKLKELADLR